MAGGKQLSFQCGEISPVMLFNSNEVSYATGLSKLKNAYVLSEGGVANRPGFFRPIWNPMTDGFNFSTAPIDFGNEDPEKSVYDENVPNFAGSPNITAFTFWNQLKLRYDIIEIGRFTDGSANDELTFRYNFSQPRRFDVDLGITGTQLIAFPVTDLKQIRIVVTKERVLFTPAARLTFITGGVTQSTSFNLSFDLRDETFKVHGIQLEDQVLFSSGDTTGNSKGVAPYFPASYVITAEGPSGYEYPVQFLSSNVADISAWDPATTPVGAFPWFPNGQVVTGMNVGFLDPFSQSLAGDIVIRVYRSSWTKQGSEEVGFYKLVSSGKLDFSVSPPKFSFQDNGAENVQIVAPVVTEYVGRFAQVRTISAVTYIGTCTYLATGKVAMNFQQRVYAYSQRPEDQDNTLPRKFDEILVSRLKCATQFTQPLLYSDTESFTLGGFLQSRGEEIRAMLPMKRALIFTSDGVHMLNGDISGIVTVLTANPSQISDVGCHAVVEPKMAGDKGFYLSSDSNKLVGIFFSEGGQVNTFEASMFSSHLLENTEFIRMEVIAGKENSVYLLTADGKLVYATVKENQICGFSTFEIDGGFIENIFKIKSRIPWANNYDRWDANSAMSDRLAAYVVRNGVRRLEILYNREENITRQFNYIDSARAFGVGNLALTSNGAVTNILNSTYPLRSFFGSSPIEPLAIVSEEQEYIIYPHISIGDNSTTNWQAGEVLTLYREFEFIEDVEDFRLDLWWFDEDKNERLLRGTVDLSSKINTPADPLPWKYNIVFESDVPLEYQNVLNKALTSLEKNTRMSQYQLAYNILPQNILKELFSRRNPSIPLDGQVPVSIYADGWIVSSPLNPDYISGAKNKFITYDEDTDTYSIDLDGDYYAQGLIGFPYETEIQTLPIEASDNRSFSAGRTLINAVGMGLNKTSGGFVGIPNSPIGKMSPMNLSQGDPLAFVQMPKPYSGYEDFTIPSEYDKGIVAIKNVDPTPITLASIYPRGESSARRQ